MQVKGGDFAANEAESGGFLYKEGSGNASCVGGTIQGHSAFEGGAIYVVGRVELEWNCDLITNRAVLGPAM